MATNPSPRKLPEPARWYTGDKVPLRVIRQFARDLADTFRPDKIILFGSRAYGRPHRYSDVDILVIMPTRNTLDQAVRISQTLDPPFPLDIIVRTPASVRWRLAEGESFLTEVMTRGKVLYEKDDKSMGSKGRGRLPGRKGLGGRKRPPA